MYTGRHSYWQNYIEKDLSSKQSIITLVDLCANSNKCPGCIVEMFCNYKCCNAWLIIKIVRDIVDNVDFFCSKCLQPNQSKEEVCRWHLGEINKTEAHNLWLTKAENGHVIIATKVHDDTVLYGKRIGHIGKHLKILLNSDNTGWVFTKSMERVGIVVACSKDIGIHQKKFITI